jgi:hypothetical protein
MSQPISSKMRAIRDPQNMMGTRAVTPHVQLAERYGGKAALREALDEARLRLQPENMRRMDMIDPALREYFPEIDYDNYDRPIDVEPMNQLEGTGTAQLIRPEDQMADGQVQMATGELEDFGGDLDRQMIGFDPDMSGINQTMTAIGLPEAGDTAARARRAVMERAMGDAILDDGQHNAFGEGYRNNDSRFGTQQAIMNRQQLRDYPMTEGIPPEMLERAPNLRALFNGLSPSDVDKTLMAIRRADGRTDLSPQDADRLIYDATQRARAQQQQGRMNIDLPTGTLVEQLLALDNLPPEVRAALGGRMGTLLSAGGAAAGVGLGGQGGQQQGPLSGLME